MKRRPSSKPRPEPTFFTDRDLGRTIPDALRAAGVLVEAHDSHFSPTTPDTEWLQHVGTRGWIALTHNKEIRYNPQERDMVMRSGVRLFMLIGHHTHPVLAQNLINTLPRIHRFLDDQPAPFIARVYKASAEAFESGKAGKVDLWLSYEEWKKQYGP